jgi:hypothetical protein
MQRMNKTTTSLRIVGVEPVTSRIQVRYFTASTSSLGYVIIIIIIIIIIITKGKSA